MNSAGVGETASYVRGGGRQEKSWGSRGCQQGNGRKEDARGRWGETNSQGTQPVALNPLWEQ